MSVVDYLGSGLARGNRDVTDWPTIRQYVLHRDGYICQMCRAAPATDVDHIWPRRYGGHDHIDNLQAACGPCNKAKGDRVDLELATEEELFLGLGSMERRAEICLDQMFTFAGHLVASGSDLALLARLRVHSLLRLHLAYVEALTS